MFCMGREMCYCLPGGLQLKYKVGWAEVSRLIWYRTFLPVGPPPDAHRIISCQLWCFWLKWRHDVDHSRSHQKCLITVLARSWELLFEEVFKDSCIWSWFASGARIVERVGLCPKVWAPQTHVYNLSPYGIFLRACSSLNYPPGSQSWVSNCPIKLFLKVLWQVRQCRSFSYTHSSHLLMSSCVRSSPLLILAQVLHVSYGWIIGIHAAH